MKCRRHSSQRRRRWNSIGSVAFALTLLAVLGLGGGFLLALLPLSSGDRSAAAPRDLSPFRSLPTTHSPPPIEPFRDAESRRDVIVAGAAAATLTNANGEVSFEPSARNLVSVNSAAISSVTSSNEFASVFNPTIFNGASERFSVEGPSAKPTVAAYESLEMASIPEPATWILLLLGILFGAFAVRSRRQSLPVESQDWIR